MSNVKSFNQRMKLADKMIKKSSMSTKSNIDRIKKEQQLLAAKALTEAFEAQKEVKGWSKEKKLESKIQKAVARKAKRLASKAA